jgi:hypothetical protein
MAQSANGFQTGFAVWPTQWVITPTQARTKHFHAEGGLTGNASLTFAVAGAGKGSIDASGLYTAPSSVSAPAVDQILVTAPDGSQGQALVYLS